MATGCGDILCSNNYSIIAGLSCFLDSCTNIFTKLSALRVDLTLCYEPSISDLSIEIDSLAVVNLLIKGSFPIGFIQTFG